MKVLLAVALMAVGATAVADSGSHYDWQTGNTYMWNSDSSGNTRVNGMNLETGSMWNTTIDRRGNQSGWDAGGNAWNYNNSTGAYFNYGTGTMCTGRGAARICN